MKPIQRGSVTTSNSIYVNYPAASFRLRALAVYIGVISMTPGLAEATITFDCNPYYQLYASAGYAPSDSQSGYLTSPTLCVDSALKQAQSNQQTPSNAAASSMSVHTSLQIVGGGYLLQGDGSADAYAYSQVDPVYKTSDRSLAWATSALTDTVTINGESYHYNLTANVTPGATFLTAITGEQFGNSTLGTGFFQRTGVTSVNESFSPGGNAYAYAGAQASGNNSSQSVNDSNRWNFSLFLKQDSFHGTTPQDPVAPDSTSSSGNLTFANPVSGLWFDPPTSTGFDYTLASGFFSDITTPSGTGFPTDSVNLYIDNILTAVLNPGDTYLFDPGISAFSLRGIDPLIEYPVLLDFTGGPSALTVTPVSASSETSVPEPGTFSLLAVAGLMLLLVQNNKWRGWASTGH